MAEKHQKTEEERWDDCLSGEHDPDLDVEIPDYLREWAEKELGVKLSTGTRQRLPAQRTTAASPITDSTSPS